MGRKSLVMRIGFGAALAASLAVAACGRSPVAAVPTPSPSADASALVGQWRNVDGTWRFEPDGRFWFMGGTTIQANPSGLAIQKTSVLQGTYAVRGATLHLTLKQHAPATRDAGFRLDGDSLRIDGALYTRQ